MAMRNLVTGVVLAVLVFGLAPAAYAEPVPEAPAQATSEGPEPPLGVDPVYPAEAPSQVPKTQAEPTSAPPAQAEPKSAQPAPVAVAPPAPAAAPSAPAQPAAAKDSGQPATADQQTYRTKDGDMYQPPAERPASPAADTEHYGRT